MLKLHLGAFDQILPGWINTDITPHLQIARVPGVAWLLRSTGRMTEARYRQHCAGIFRNVHRLDVTRRFPLANQAVDAVAISHMLSNLTRAGASYCLGECHRVLKRGGVLRIATVDLDDAVRHYEPQNADRFMDLLFDLDTSHRAKNRHWWHYNEVSLGAALRTAGFAEVYRCAFREGQCPDVELVDSRPGSLFMEAVK